MPHLIVRKLEPALIRRLRKRAAAEGISVEEAHRRVLRQALLGEAAGARKNFLEYLRAMPETGKALTLVRAKDRPRDVGL